MLTLLIVLLVIALLFGAGSFRNHDLLWVVAVILIVCACIYVFGGIRA